MIVDIVQNRNIIDVSYVNEKGNIDMVKYDIYKTNGYGNYDYMICDENDPNKHPILRHYKDELPIKRVPSTWLDFDEMREFLNVTLPIEERNKIHAFNPYKIWMLDIEINTTGGDVFPNPNLAEFPIDSIQITGEDLSTLVLSCNERVQNDPEQRKIVEDMINKHYEGNPYVKERIKYGHLKFKTEVEMLEFFLKAVNEKLHVVSFWAGDYFDIPYVYNRCNRLGIDQGISSPTGQVSTRDMWAKHRYAFDYMKLVKDNAFDIDRTTFSLDHCAKEIVGVGKIAKEGDSYTKLYNGDIHTFLTYGAVDTISMQLIHRVKNYTVAQQSLVFYCKATLKTSEQVTSQVHSLLWDELYRKNLINAEPYVKQPKVAYGGGYVKEPTRKFCMFPVCEDFSALYPRVMQSYNISFENYVGKLSLDDLEIQTLQKEAKEKAIVIINNELSEGKITQENYNNVSYQNMLYKKVYDELYKEHYNNKKQKLISLGYIITLNDNIYKNDKDYTLKIVETNLLQERYDYKELRQEVFLDVMPIIDNEIKKRNLHHVEH